MALMCRVVTPEKAFFEGEAHHVVAPGWDGELAVYARHAPLIAKLGHGVLTIHPASGGAPMKLALYGGFLKVQEDEVTVLASGADEPGKPDKARTDLAAARDKVKRSRPPKTGPGEFENILEEERRARARVAAAKA
ncbi:ATP synthase F1 subunit epsilon [bacterium]|nr:ATP synthase F1 subunit epsilon [bacterium]